jgi:hypothetical protein
VIRPLELIAQPRGARVGLAGWRFGLGSGHACGSFVLEIECPIISV